MLAIRYMLGLLVVAATLSACATIPSQIVSIGPDTYQLNMTGVGFATQGNTNMKALKAASNYCAGLGKRMVLQHSEENGVYGFSPRQDTIAFKCAG
jgi:hypothetical protein